MDLIYNIYNHFSSDEEPTHTTSTVAKEATLNRSNEEALSVNSVHTNDKQTSVRAKLQSTRVIPPFRDHVPGEVETREAENETSQITERSAPAKYTNASGHEVIQKVNKIFAAATKIVLSKPRAPPISNIVATEEEESNSIVEEREGFEDAASTTTAMTTTVPTNSGIEKLLEEYDGILPNDAFLNAVNEETTKVLIKMNEEYGTLLPNDAFWIAVREAATKVLSKMSKIYGVLLPKDACWNAVVEATTKALIKMNGEFNKAYEEMSIQVKNCNESTILNSIGEAADTMLAAGTIFGTGEESLEMSYEQYLALQKAYEEIAINLNGAQRATIREIIEAAKIQDATNTAPRLSTCRPRRYRTPQIRHLD